jgi:hypothetical protein
VNIEFHLRVERRVLFGSTLPNQHDWNEVLRQNERLRKRKRTVERGPGSFNLFGTLRFMQNENVGEVIDRLGAIMFASRQLIAGGPLTNPFEAI